MVITKKKEGREQIATKTEDQKSEASRESWDKGNGTNISACGVSHEIQLQTETRLSKSVWNSRSTSSSQ